MTQDEKWEFLTGLDDELLLGGANVSEWAAFLIRDADEAFCAGANLAAILAAQAAMECHLRQDYCAGNKSSKRGFYDLIQGTALPDDLRADLHTIRAYRNKWVHVDEPEADENLLTRPKYYHEELERMAKLAIRSMRRVIYLDQFV